MSAPFPLERMQRWMLEVVAHPGDLEQALAAPRAELELPRAELERLILPSATLSAAERVGIYQSMYLLRMEEALSTDYPALQHFLGERGFFAFVRDYVQVYPSRSYTLNRLGDHVPEFIRNAKGLRQQGFLEDLARLELAITEVFDAPETPALREAGLASIGPDEWDRAVFEPVASLRLLALRHNANDYVDSLKDDAHHHPRPRRKQTWLAVLRREYAVYRQELAGEAYRLLSDLVAGRTLGVAVASALARGRGRLQEQQLFRWFRDWIALGVFASVRIRPA